MRNKTYLFIDGTNLYAGQYELFGSNKYLDFALFVKQIEKRIKIQFEKIYFYASYSPQPKNPNEKEKLYLKNEAQFYKSVKETKNLAFFKGYRSKKDNKEKEVDVKLSVDIVHLAHLKEYDRLYFISEDADFTHALMIARKLRVEVNILALENRIPLRFVYLFPTLVLTFGKISNFQIKEKQKIQLLRLSEECIRKI